MAGFSERLDFPGHDGSRLAALLELPPGRPRAYAVFAHCFTCSKDIFAASRIAEALAGRGIAVLRFDFTGLGASEGELANTDFSSNVADLVAAADHLRATRQAPALLVGHSLGGAAVLAAAGEIPEVRAVVTIGAPADAAHVVENFVADVARIEAAGEAEVTLAGRKFTIRRQFLEDVAGARLAERVAALRRPLLIFHAPRDETVGIENAAAIFRAAKHPKSFVSLDDADHLLRRQADSIYVAEVLAAGRAATCRPPRGRSPTWCASPRPGCRCSSPCRRVRTAWWSTSRSRRAAAAPGRTLTTICRSGSPAAPR
jgi:putative redox protein